MPHKLPRVLVFKTERFLSLNSQFGAQAGPGIPVTEQRSSCQVALSGISNALNENIYLSHHLSVQWGEITFIKLISSFTSSTFNSASRVASLSVLQLSIMYAV